MASTRMTLGAVLGTVQTTAATVTGVLDAANQGITMLSRFVETASEQQAIRHIVEKEDFIETLIREKAQERSHQDLAVQKFCQQSKDHADFYSKNYQTYTQLLRTTEQ